MNQFYGWAMRKNPIIYNKTAVRGWAGETAAWYRHPLRCFAVFCALSEGMFDGWGQCCGVGV